MYQLIKDNEKTWLLVRMNHADLRLIYKALESYQDGKAKDTSTFRKVRMIMNSGGKG